MQKWKQQSHYAQMVKSTDERSFVKRTEYHNEIRATHETQKNTKPDRCTSDQNDIANRQVMYEISNSIQHVREWVVDADRGKTGSYERSFVNYAIICENKLHGHMRILHKPTGNQSRTNIANGCWPTFVVHTNDRSQTGRK